MYTYDPALMFVQNKIIQVILLTFAIVGHILGDYFAQTKWMALNKKKDSPEGYRACALHCLVYTIIMVIVTGAYNIIFALIIFAGHFFLDKFDIVDNYLEAIKGRTIKSILKAHGNNLEEKVTLETSFMVAYTVLVHTVIDNSIHIIWALVAMNIYIRL